MSAVQSKKTVVREDVEYFKKARIGIGIVSSAIRLAATIENSRTNDMLEARAVMLHKEPLALAPEKLK